jgi:hypothetical protein
MSKNMEKESDGGLMGVVRLLFNLEATPHKTVIAPSFINNLKL